LADLEFEKVTVRYGRVDAVRAATLSVPSGAVVGLVGESGSGKSSLGRAAVGLAPTSAGRITLGGVDRRTLPRRGQIQIVFQDPSSSLDPRMRIGASIAEAIAGHRRGRLRRYEDRVADLLELVGLEPNRADARPGELSGGQRQRVAIARALAAEPAVIIADEITSALDVSVQGSILNLVRRLQGELGFGLLFISHNISVVRYVSNMIAVMYQGQIIEYGATEQVINEPTKAYTRDLLSTAREAALSK
jgi:peptide/nickel transport system ATP-binding protein